MLSIANRYYAGMTKDLTEGNPFNLIVSFSLPVLGGNLFQQFYNLVDTVIVGQFLGKEALAAVGATGSVCFLIIGFCIGICSGFTIPVSQKFGAKDFRTMRQYIAGSWFWAIVIAAGMTLLTALATKPLLRLMLTPENIIDQASAYVRIIFLGIPTVFLYNLVSGFIRSVGDSKTPLYFLIFSSCLNIVLDLVFILGCRMGVTGAALATVISQAVAGLACFFYMNNHFEILRLTKDDLTWRPHHFSVLLGNGIPMGLQYSITAIGSVILQTSVNTLGSDAVAAIAAASKISMLFCCMFDALGTTMATWGGQNTGAGKLERLKSGLFHATLIGSVYSIAAFLVLWLWGKQLGMMFVNANETALLSDVQLFLFWNGIFYIPLALVNIVRFLIQGMGFSKLAVLAGVFEMIARAVFGIAFVPVWGYVAAVIANPAAWILADCFLIPAFYSCYRKLAKWEIEHQRM